MRRGDSAIGCVAVAYAGSSQELRRVPERLELSFPMLLHLLRQRRVNSPVNVWDPARLSEQHPLLLAGVDSSALTWE